MMWVLRPYCRASAMTAAGLPFMKQGDKGKRLVRLRLAESEPEPPTQRTASTSSWRRASARRDHKIAGRFAAAVKARVRGRGPARDRARRFLRWCAARCVNCAAISLGD